MMIDERSRNQMINSVLKKYFFIMMSPIGTSYYFIKTTIAHDFNRRLFYLLPRSSPNYSLILELSLKF